ncbi:hypothetical protein Tco_0248100 [Tanacetum coccineum]
MLPPFQAIGLESFLTLNEPICPRFMTEFYHSLEVKRSGDDYPYIEFKFGSFTFQLSLSILLRIFNTPLGGSIFYTHEWSLNSLDTHFNNHFFHPEPELVKQTITILRTTNRKLQIYPNTLFHDDLCLEVQGWELFIRENVFNILGPAPQRQKALDYDNSGPAPTLQKTSDHNNSELRLHDHINEPSSSTLVSNVSPSADKNAL